MSINLPRALLTPLRCSIQNNYCKSIIADRFVRCIANIKNIVANIADCVVAIIWIKVSHAVTAICVWLISMVMSLPRSTLRTMLGVRRTNSAKSSPLTA